MVTVEKGAIWRRFWLLLVANVGLWGGLWWFTELGEQAQGGSVAYPVPVNPEKGETKEAGKIGLNLVSLSEAIRLAESGTTGDYAIGDRKLKNKAYGPMQIRLPCLQDVNQFFAEEIKQKFGKNELTLADVQGNRATSLWVFEKYVGHYATKKRLGREPTDEDRARIWNGGPSAWREPSTAKNKKEAEKRSRAKRYWQERVRPHLSKK